MKTKCPHCNTVHDDAQPSRRAVMVLIAVIAMAGGWTTGFFSGGILTRPNRQKVDAEIAAIHDDAQRKINASRAIAAKALATAEATATESRPASEIVFPSPVLTTLSCVHDFAQLRLIVDLRSFAANLGSDEYFTTVFIMIDTLNKKVKKLEKPLRASTPELRLLQHQMLQAFKAEQSLQMLIFHPALDLPTPTKDQIARAEELATMERADAIMQLTGAKLSLLAEAKK